MHNLCVGTELSAALIAGGISLAVALLSVVATWRTVHSETRRLERELQRRLTERLIDRRLGIYPRAFEITERLRGEHLNDRGLSDDEATKLREELATWNRSDAALIMSRRTLKAFRALRDHLRRESRTEAAFSREERQKILQLKNEFRRAMRADVQLLYEEEGDA